MSRFSWSRLQIAYFVGLIACVSGALLGQAELVGEPWHHYLSVLSIAGTAVTGYLMQPPRDPTDRTRANDSQP